MSWRADRILVYRKPAPKPPPPPPGSLRQTLSRLREAISIAGGELWHDLELPNLSPTAPPGALPVLGEVTWL